MNIWKLTSPNTLVKEETEEESIEGKLRVRITKVLVCNFDAEILTGKVKVSYPHIPGRFAVGMVAGDSDNPLFPKGRRVVLHTFLPAPDLGTEVIDFSRCDYEICGASCDGFLRDVIYVSPDEMTPLPDSVNDEQALLLHHVALAKASVDKLNARKGQHVAVVGANLFGIFVCQLLIYQQVAPILIDCDQARLDFARNCGIYYTALADDKLVENVAAITGGRLASGAVYSISSKHDAAIALSVCARKAGVVMSGLNSSSVSVDVELILKKQLVLQAVSDCSDCLETAINLTAQGAVSYDYFTADIVRANDAQAAFSREGRDVSRFRYVNLV